MLGKFLPQKMDSIVELKNPFGGVKNRPFLPLTSASNCAELSPNFVLDFSGNDGHIRIDRRQVPELKQVSLTLFYI